MSTDGQRPTNWVLIGQLTLFIPVVGLVVYILLCGAYIPDQSYYKLGYSDGFAEHNESKYNASIIICTTYIDEPGENHKKGSYAYGYMRGCDEWAKQQQLDDARQQLDL